jgi:hypothetical protein
MTVRDPLGAVVAWLAHPVSVLGLALLLVNDHVLKPALIPVPGAVTGKLSDVAGMVMFPPLLAVLMALLLPRARAKTLAVVALCVTACGFCWLKFSWYAAELASAALTVVSGPSVLRADPADLLALPALALAWLAFRRARERPIASGDARLARVVVLLPLALLGTAATSCGLNEGPPPVVAKSPDGSVWLRSQAGDGVEYQSTADGGLTFHRAGPARTPVVREQDCAGRACYRVVRGHMLVQQRIGTGEWTTAWRLDPGQRRDLIAATATCEDPEGEHFESQALVVIPQPGGHIVLVSNGDDGLLRRDVSGRWTRIGWGAGTSPAALSQGVLPGGNRFFSVALVVLILLIGGLGVTALKARAGWPRSRWALLSVLAAGVAIGLDTEVIMWGETAHPLFVLGSATFSIAAILLAALFSVLAHAWLSRGWTTVMVLLVAGVAWLSETMRQESLMLGDGISLAAVVVMGFIVVALIGLGAGRRHPRQIG